jgi:hypothetical protein
VESNGVRPTLNLKRATITFMNEYQLQIKRYKQLREIYYGESENKVVLEDSEFKSMLIQLKRSIMTKRNRTTENQILFKSEFPEE